MSALIIDIIDAVVTDLNAATFTKSLTAELVYDPEVELKDLVGGRIVIAPASKERCQGIARSLDSRNLAIDVCVQAKIAAIPGSDTAEITAWMAYVDEVEAFLARLCPTTLNTVQAVGVENKPAYSLKHLKELRVFMSVLTVSFRVDWSVT